MVTYNYLENYVEALELPLESDIVVDPLSPSRIMKRAFDIVAAGLVTVFILTWLIPLLGILIKLSSRGPVFFVQVRTGRKGRPFLCLKFRTMFSEKIPENAEYQQATRNDARITELGRFLRKSNLDEMPQFLNVLMGQMSVVGPRPHPIKLDAKHWNSLPGYRSRYSVKPGITGLAQVRGARGETREAYRMVQRVRYDHWYIRNQSPWLDAKICWWTVESTVKAKDENAF